MTFFSFLQRNRMFVHYIAVFIILIGVFSISKLRREARPNVDFNRVAVSIAYPGASPDDVEELLIDPIEEKIAEVNGVEEYRSVSFSGAGSISIQIDEDYPDPSEVVDEVRRKISEVNDFPDTVDDPVITEIKAENIPVLKIALYGTLKPFEMKLQAEKLKDYFRTFDGVQSVEYSGIEDLQYKIQADPSLLVKYDITLPEIISSTKNWSRQKPGGLIDNSKESTNITVNQNLDDVPKIKNHVLRSNTAGYSVKISDVADVTLDTEDMQLRSLFGDKNAILMTVIKKPAADAITTVDEVKAGLETFKKTFPEGLEYKLYTDESKRVRDRLSVVLSNAIFGLLLVMILLVVFLDWRSALVTSMGIPVAIFGGLFLIFALGQTLNSLVLVGIIIVLGMLVDDAIVVCENIYAHIEDGMTPTQAAVHGVSEIAIPVVATVLTTVFAFLPIVYMQGIMGQFLSVIPITVIAMLLFSLFEALVILPVHSSEIMKAVKHSESRFVKWEKRYQKYLEWSLKKRWHVIGVLCVFGVLSLFMGKFLFDGFTLFPAKGLNGVSVRVEIPKNSPTDLTERYAKELSNLLIDVSEESYDSIFSSIGQTTTGGLSGSRQQSSNLAKIDIIFTSDPSFDLEKEKRVLTAIKKVSKDYSKAHDIKTSITLDREGPPIGKPIQLQVTSRDLNLSGDIINQIRAEFEKVDGVYALETDLDEGTKKYRFQINEEQALADGILPSHISQAIFAASTGLVSEEVLKKNEKIEIMVGIKDSLDLSVDDILNLRVRNKYNQDVPIKYYATYVEEFGPSSIQRFNGVRTITLFGEVDEKVTSGKLANQAVAPFIKELRQKYKDVKIEKEGGEKERMEVLQDTMRLYVLALVMIFMTISLSFRSLSYPFLVLLSIPLGVFGVIWALTVHGQSLSMMSLIGIVGLSGVVVNVSIVMLKFVQDHIQEHGSIDEAIIEAGVRRLRPIVITTLTTLIGLAPTIYGLGGMDYFVQPIALTLGWGLAVGTTLTLFALPSLVSVAMEFRLFLIQKLGLKRS